MNKIDDKEMYTEYGYRGTAELNTEKERNRILKEENAKLVEENKKPVSYTHLTLPTIYSV